MRARIAVPLVFALAASCSSTPPARHATSGTPAPASSRATVHKSGAPRIDVVLASWQLPSPLSREIVLPDGDGLIVLGGLDAAGASTRTVLRADPATATVVAAGSLARPTHDAGGALLGGRYLLFGGGEQTTIPTVESFVPGQGARVIANLPQPRSDLSVATTGGRAIIVGGFDGKSMTPDVLSTPDGTHFEVVASLPVPVRYAAVAVAGDALYVFGGVTGHGDSNAIQRIDLTARSAQVVAVLPRPLSHAAAVRIGAAVYVLGGRHGAAPTSQILRFDPGSRKTTIDPSQLRLAVSDAGLATAGGHTFLIGGETGPQHRRVRSIQTVSVVAS